MRSHPHLFWESLRFLHRTFVESNFCLMYGAEHKSIDTKDVYQLGGCCESKREDSLFSLCSTEERTELHRVIGALALASSRIKCSLGPSDFHWRKARLMEGGDVVFES